MRVTDKMAFNQTTNNLSKNRSEMSELQNQAATQRRINKPSDDPAASARVLVSRTEERGSKQFIKNINQARSFLEYTDQSLSELTEALVRAKELAIQQANDAGASAETRRTVAAEVSQIHSQAVQIGNRKLADRYIFAGYKTTTAPFDPTGEYHGDDGDIRLQINKDAFVAMNLPGDQVFVGRGMGEDGLIRPSATVPKDTTDLLKHKAEEQQRQQRIEQMQTEPVQLRGPASVNGRADQTVSSRVKVEAAGVNVLQVLKDFEVALQTNDKEEIQAAIDNVDSAISQVVNARAQVGSRVSSLNAATDSLQKAIVDHKVTASQLEDADLYEVVSDMNKTDSTLKATLETSGKVMNLSLLDFLR
ncbi:MAG: flagellar hook-associated protein FlgL [Pseudobdellovibrionaceae bacterium]